MNMKILQIDFDTILSIWKEQLWPNRTSPIESHSAMRYLSKEYDIENFALPSQYLGCYIDNMLIGVNSCHLCIDGSARSRGLWVSPDHRRKGIGQKLLNATVNFAKSQNSILVWSYSRKTSWPTYNSVGFELSSDWEKSETSEANAYCYIKL